jgi:hypothetical protein
MICANINFLFPFISSHATVHHLMFGIIHTSSEMKGDGDENF